MHIIESLAKLPSLVGGLIFCIMAVCYANPPLTFRGTAGILPFHLGTTLYNGAWAGFAENDHSHDWWWFDKNHWSRLFQQYESAHLNTIVFWHPHPYVGFIKLNRFQEAAYLSPEETDRQIEMFRWITSEGKKHGISIYFQTWNICLPPGFCKAHGLEEFGADTPLVKEYTRYSVAELFRTYPDLGGLVTMAAESPPGCTDFVLEAILPGLQDAVGPNSPRKELPRLIFWTWCSYPEDALKVLEAYPGETHVLHYLQYEQFFKPMADPRIAMTSKALGNRKVIAMGGPSTATGWLYWGDPFFIQKTMQDLVSKNGEGIFFSGTDSFAFIAERWIAREAFERYSYDPFVQDDSTYWENRVADRYGNASIAKPLLHAMIATSNIMPRFMCLVHSQTDHYHPQCGLPLVNYLEMPTISTYVFENHDSVDKNGRLVPCMGLTWPNPDWGEKVLSIRDYVNSGKASSQEATITTPVEIADEIEQLAKSSLEEIREVRKTIPQITIRQKELENTLALMEMNCWLGLHYAEKIRAGIAWESWKSGQANAYPSQVLRHLSKSISYWEELCRGSLSVVPYPVHFWRSEVPSEPPWDHWDLWLNYQWVKMHWRDMIPIFEREKNLIEQQLRGDRKLARLPLFPELNLPVGRISTVTEYDFEGTLPSELLLFPSKGDIVKIVKNPHPVISGNASLLCDTRGSNEEWHLFLRTDSSKLKLIPGRQYVLEFNYRTIDPGKERFPFAAAARTETGGWQKDTGSPRFWRGNANQTGHKVITLEPRDYDDYYIFFSVRHKAAIILDDIRLSVVTPE